MMVIKGGDSEQRHKSPTRRSPGKHPQAGQHHMEEASRHTEGRRVWQGTWMWSEGLRWWDLSFFSTPRSVILPGGREVCTILSQGWDITLITIPSLLMLFLIAREDLGYSKGYMGTSLAVL